MTPGIEEALRLLRLAEKDLRAFLVMKDHPDVTFGIACFHAQQAVEKSIKAILFFHGIEFRRIHDLEELAALLSRNGVDTPVSIAQIGRLNPFAVSVRYDDEDIPTISLKEVQTIAETLFEWSRKLVEEGLK